MQKWMICPQPPAAWQSQQAARNRRSVAFRPGCLLSRSVTKLGRGWFTPGRAGR
jgi:hypothetical protein